jgi:AcrR family transcriptional regulator
MAETALSTEQILEAAEDVLRRFGPAKATVVDVARALGVSHGTVYRHFPSKAALRGAVTQRWLDRAHAALPAVAGGSQPADVRVRLWLETLYTAKKHKALADPELFATYSVLVDESSALIGVFADVGDPLTLAHVVFQATAHFHDPAYAPTWAAPDADQDFAALVGLVLRGLAAD